MSERSVLIRVQEAACGDDCPLPPEARHLVMVMALAADSRTGKGFKGQTALGAMLGKSARQVRRLIETVNSTPGSPVRIEQVARFRSEGRGRTSNAYQLILINRTPTSSSSEESSGHPRPDESAFQEDADVPLNDAATGHPRPDESTTNRTSRARLTGHPGQTNRTPTSGDLSAKRSAKGSAMYLDASKRAEPKRRWTRVPKGWQPNDSHRTLAAAEPTIDFDHELAQFRDHEFAKPKKDPDACFRTWLRNAAKFQAGRGRGQQPKRAPQRGMASHVQTGDLEAMLGS